MAKDMTIYSWNMLCRNRELNRAFDFIAQSDFDIFCLQEVPEGFLARLKTLTVEVASIPESDRVIHGERSTLYSVILSRYPIGNVEAIILPFHDPDFPIRGKLFIRFMSLLRLWTKGAGNRHVLSADLHTPNGLLHVFNLHLSLTNPLWRQSEYELALAKSDASRPTIVCGDFNILEKPHITSLNWFLGGRVSDTLFYARERAHIEKRFAEHGLKNPLRGESTHPLSRSQLDHILLSRHLTVHDASVISDRNGSDHHPIRVVASNPSE